MGIVLRNQRGLCALSGITLTFTKGKGHIPTNASIDRIDPAKGYIRGNVQLVACQVNTMKSNLSLPELVRWCQLIINCCPTRPAPPVTRQSKKTTPRQSA
jgi:hypothetical protein